MLGRGARARRQAPPTSHAMPQSLFAKEEGDRPSTGGEETDSYIPKRDFCCGSDRHQHRKLRGAFRLLGRGRRGTDWNRASARASAKERVE